MEISALWLSEFVELPPLEQLVARLAGAGMEVEAVRDPSTSVAGVVVGLVEACEPHPEAERLKVCRVFDGNERFQVVCGAANVRVGLRVAFAKPGARLPGLAIVARQIRGVLSAGMLCAKDELGFGEKEGGIWVLPAEAPLGSDAMAQAQVGPSLTLATAPNRPDLLSHLGVARELGAATGKRLKSTLYRVTEQGPDVSSLARVVVDDAAGCKRYLARVVRNVKVGPSPEWLKSKLEQVGQRSINNVVDATNYVLLELGQPLHAFDLAKIGVEANLATVRVRRAKAGESLKIIDGTIVKLDPEDLVIADATTPMALAGVMGGADSEVSAETTTVLLESAWFDPSRVRRTARRHGLRTEASQRFERGADPGMAQKAIDRCAQLLVEIAEGVVAKGTVEVAQKAEPPREVALRLARVPRLLGIELSAEDAVQLLEPLEIRCLSRNETTLRFAPPSFRPDLVREIDLIEELARRHGYDRIPETLPGQGGPYFSETVRERPEDLARRVLIPAGLSEIVTFGFGSPERFSTFVPEGAGLVSIQNPLGAELAAMRTSLIPGLLTVLVHNQRHGQKHVRLFETGTVFYTPPSPRTVADERERELPYEERRLGLLLSGGRAAGRWFERGESVDFSDLAGVVETLTDVFEPAGSAVRRPLTGTSTMNPNASAELVIGDEVAGRIGQLAPSLLRAYEADGPVYVAELSLAVLAGRRRTVRAQPLPRFPGTRRDIALVAPKEIAAETLRRFLLEHAGGKLGSEVVENVRLFDMYTGKPIPETHVSLAFAIDYRNKERTLTDAEVAEAFMAVQAELRSRFPIEVRSAT
jgi:phenylalanyl-tRNA synthetase beta chain